MAFFEQIGKRITDAGQNVAQKTRNLADITQLNNAISENEKKISQLILTIGQSYYERHRNDSTAEELDKITEVNALYAEILQSREKIKQIKGVIKCSNCGADIPLNAAFCNSCGTKVEHTENIKIATSDANLCPVCHSAINKDNLFCNYCGTKIENINR